MTEPKQDVKTLGVKLKNGLHAQFALIAQVENLSLADAVIQAVELYVATKQGEPDFQQRAAEILAEIEREAEARRTAIQALLGSGTPAAEEPAKPRSRRAGNQADA